MRQAPQKFVTPIVMNNCLTHNGAKRGHTLR